MNELSVIKGIGEKYEKKLASIAKSVEDFIKIEPEKLAKILGKRHVGQLPYFYAQAQLIADKKTKSLEVLVKAKNDRTITWGPVPEPSDVPKFTKEILSKLEKMVVADDPTSKPKPRPRPNPKPNNAMQEPIVCLNMRRREIAAKKKLKSELDYLDGLENPSESQLSRIQELKRKSGQNILDPLFREVAEDLGKKITHRDGILPSQLGKKRENLSDSEKELVGIFGILLRENVSDPSVKGFSKELYRARGEYKECRLLYEKVADILAVEGNRANYPDDHLVGRFIREKELATVVESLKRQGVKHHDIHLTNIVRTAIARFATHDENRPSLGLEINLPDLEDFSDVEIITDNLHAMQAIYFASMLEQVKFFQVRDKLVELFQMGMLPIGRGHAGDLLFRQMREQHHRFSEYERRNIFARTLGIPGGDPGQNPNREFQTSWLRFVSAVSSFARQLNLDNLLRASIPASVSQEQVRKSGRDLAANLSLYGYGMAFFAATELQSEINETIDLLSDDEIKGAYGARDMWGVIEQVSAFELGGPQDTVRYRTMASAGAVIIRWLADHSRELSSVGTVEILNSTEIASPTDNPSSPTVSPLDSDLVNACERWLAVTGTPEAQIETYSEPSVTQTSTSQPIQIPAFARDLLGSVGVTNGIG